MKKYLTLLFSLIQLVMANVASAQDYPFEEGVRVRDVVTLPEGLTGKGVLVGVIDNDIAYNHVNFLDPKTMQTRVKTVLDFEWSTKSFIRYNNPDEISKLKVDDSGGHGTHTSGIAAGSYDADGWQGIATEADLCFGDSYRGAYVDLNMAELKELFSVADSLNMPLVINMSIGPIKQYDGYDEMNLLCEELTENGNRPGRIIVVATANSGDAFAYMESKIGSEGKARYAIKKESMGEGWDGYDVNFKFEILKTCEEKVRLFLYDKAAKTEVTTGLLDPNGNPLSIDELSDYLTSTEKGNSPYRYYTLDYMDEVTFTSEDLHLCFEVTESEGTEIRYIENVTVMEGDDFFAPVRSIYGNANSMVNTPAVISVGRYDTHFPGRTPIGKNSSFGFNKYGEKFPDVVAPGTGIISSGEEGRSDHVAKRDINMPDGTTRTFSWMTMQGTSQASPLVAGIVALMLQYDPTLTVNRMRELLHSTNDWNEDCDNAPMGPNQAGHGILNTKALFEKLMGPTAIEAVATDASDNSIYDLLGRRLTDAPEKGIFIRNNKKIIK